MTLRELEFYSDLYYTGYRKIGYFGQSYCPPAFLTKINIMLSIFTLIKRPGVNPVNQDTGNTHINRKNKGGKYG